MLTFAPAAIIVLQILVVGPLFMIASNKERSALEFGDILQGPFVISIVFAAALGVVIWFARNVWGGRIVAFAWVVAFYLLAQFFWIVPDFGVLDGRQIEFAAHWYLAIAELFFVFSLLLIAIAWPAATTRYMSRLAAATFLVTSTQTVVALFQIDIADQSVHASASPDFFKDAQVHDVLNLGQENAIVILVDTFQGDAFEKVVAADPSLQERLSGFTFYNNVIGHFPYTGLSVPAILSGAAYRGGEQSIPAYTSAAGLKRLEAVFEASGLRWGRIPLGSRASFLDPKAFRCRAFSSIYDASLFRQLPLIAKAHFYASGELQIEKRCGAAAVPANTSALDLAVLNKLSEGTVVDGGKPKMVYIHLWGMHPPTNLSRTCNLVSPSTTVDRYLDQAHCMIVRIADYIDRLRSVGAFDNSAIFIVADHGTKYGFFRDENPNPIPGFVRSSANPVMIYHAPGQSGSLLSSAAPLALTDIYPTILKDFGISIDGEGKAISTIHENENRERIFLFYKGITDIYGEFIPQIERFSVNGHVRNPDNWKSLGVEANIAEPLGLVDFGTPQVSKYLNFGWSEEAPSVPVSWLIANPATITGVLPENRKIRVIMMLMNPHPGQKIVFKINGQVIGEIDEPAPTAWVERHFVFDSQSIGSKPTSITLDASVIKQISAKDTRKIGVAFDWIRFDPEQ